jgi:hypothetical protein
MDAQLHMNVEMTVWIFGGAGGGRTVPCCGGIESSIIDKHLDSSVYLTIGKVKYYHF